MGRVKDITGQKFGKLKVLKQAPQKERKQSSWHCICDCGTRCVKRGTSLRFGWVKSCGCMSGISETPKYIDSIIKWSMRWYIGGASIRDLSFHLTKSQFTDFIQKPCHYCGFSGRDIGAIWYQEKISRKVRGITSTFDFRAKSVKLIANGIDRIDNSKGYTIANCVPCCTKCNMMKKDLTEQDFLSHIAKIFHIQNRSNRPAI